MTITLSYEQAQLLAVLMESGADMVHANSPRDLGLTRKELDKGLKVYDDLIDKFSGT